MEAPDPFGLSAAHARAFSAAEAMPASLRTEILHLLDHLVATGAPFHEARTALQRLVDVSPATPEEPDSHGGRE